MPADFTLPPDTRAIGTGNPPQDVDNIVDALTSAGAGYSVLNAAWAGGADPTGANDSTAAVQAALTAACANSGAVYFPAGTYKINTTLHITGPCKITGAGMTQSAPAGSVTPAVVINSSATGGLFDFPWQGYLWTGLEVANLAISYTGSGDVFHLINLIGGYFHDMQITITDAASTVVRTTGSVSVLNCQWERVWMTSTSATRSNNLVNLSSTTSGSISNNTFWRCTFSNTGLDNTQYMVYIDCAGGSGAYHYMECFRDCWFEHPFGGAVKSLSGMAMVIDGCTVWDLQSGQGQTVGASTYYIGAYPSTGPGSQQTRINGCSRNRNGPNGSTTWDIFCEATTSGTIIEGFSVKPDTPSTLTNAYFNFSSHPDIQVIGCVCPQGAAVNGNSTTVISNPGWSCTTIGAGASANTLDLVQAPFWTPLDSGALAWTFDPALLIGGGTVLGSTGVTYLNRVNVRRGITVTNVVVYLHVAGSVLTSGQCFVGLFNSSGTLVGASADQATAWGSGAPKLVTAALVGGPYALAAGFYWVGILANWGTTAPSFGRAQTLGTITANFGVGTAATARFATAAGTSTSLASFTPSAGAVAGVSYWAALT